MKTHAACLALCAASLLLFLGGTGCTQDKTYQSGTAERKRIPLAPIGSFSPGIGSPGAGSVDTRGTGTIATGEGDTPIAEPSSGSVPAAGAGNVPGAATVNGPRTGGRL